MLARQNRKIDYVNSTNERLNSTNRSVEMENEKLREKLGDNNAELESLKDRFRDSRYIHDENARLRTEAGRLYKSHQMRYTFEGRMHYAESENARLLGERDTLRVKLTAALQQNKKRPALCQVTATAPTPPTATATSATASTPPSATAPPPPPPPEMSPAPVHDMVTAASSSSDSIMVSSSSPLSPVVHDDGLRLSLHEMDQNTTVEPATTKVVVAGPRVAFASDKAPVPLEIVRARRDKGDNTAGVGRRRNAGDSSESGGKTEVELRGTARAGQVMEGSGVMADTETSRIAR